MSRFVVCIAVLVVPTVVFPTTAVAQLTAGPNLVGQKVRVTPRGSDVAVVGVVATRDSESIGLSSGFGEVQSVPFDRIGRLEISLGWQNNVDQGVVVGAVSCALLAGLYGVGIANAVSESKTKVGLAFAGAAAIPGALIGGIVGSLSGSERWEEVSYPRQEQAGLHLQVLPTTGGGMQVGVSLGFE